VNAHPELHFGTGLLESLDCHPQRTAFVTMEIPWNLVVRRLASQPEHVLLVRSLERAALDEAVNDLPDLDAVVGVGGGSCMDFAKYLAWKRNLPLILIPSIVSVDACVTRSVAVRDGGRVRYVGDVRAERLLVDFDLISQAPPRLNRAGAGDILSIQTASFDWMLAHKRHGERYDQGATGLAAGLLGELEANAAEIKAVSPKGIRVLVELFEAENDLCEDFGNSRPEEGSEHFFAYNAEHQTRRPFVHGEIVGLGVLLMSRLQENRPEWVLRVLDDLGLLYRPADIGLDVGELRSTLSTLADFCVQEAFPHTVVNEAPLSPDVIDSLVSDLEGTA
jgi:glycerol-1-phosphate dehydrogenase [NAD(P)+]